MAKSINLQDSFLNGVRKEGVGVQIYLLNSVQIRGKVRGFDAFTILLDSPGKPTQLVYKHAIASIVPLGPLVDSRAPRTTEDDREPTADEEPPDQAAD